MQISRIRLSDKTSRLHPRHVVPKRSQADKPEVPVQVREWIAAQRNAFFLPPEPPLWCIDLERWSYHTNDWKQWLSDNRAGKNPLLPASE